MYVMKNHFLLLFLSLSFISCHDEVKFNTPAFQGQKDNVLWRASTSKATLTDNRRLSIEGFVKNEKLTLKTEGKTPKKYVLGTGISNTAVYVVTKNGSFDITFETGDGVGNGEVVIEEYDELNKTVTGTFKFNAVNSGSDTSLGTLLNYQYGKFYKVPVSLATL